MKNRLDLFLREGIILLICLVSSSSFAQTYDIKDFGAVSDAVTINTKAIQTAINKCAETGGEVVIPKGVFMSGTLYLKSKVNITIKEGGVLKASPFFRDYPDNIVHYQNAFTHSTDGKSNANKAFIFAEEVNDISITGKGTIDGSGDSPAFNLGNDDTPKSRLRPCMLLIINSKHIKLSDITLTNSAYWMQNYLGCEYLDLRGLKIFNHSNYNQDGIDVDARHVLIENCHIDVDDDGICFKSHDKSRFVEDIVVRNCFISSNCNAIKFGTKSMGGLKNVSITHCTVQQASADCIRHWQKTLQFIDQPITVISGIALESVDGALIDHITIADIVMKDVQTPIFIVLGNRGAKQMGDKRFYDTSIDPGLIGKQAVGKITNVVIKNIMATGHSKMTSSITAFPGHYIENVQFSNIIFNDMGTGTLEEGNAGLKENPGAYPENRMYGQVYPSSGLYVRHVTGLVLDHVELKVRDVDYRPSIVFDDVLDSKILFLTTAIPGGKTAAVKLINSKNIIIESPVFKTKDSPFLQLLNCDPENVKITGFQKYKGWVL